MPIERSPEFVGKDSGSFGKRESCGRIQADIPDFVAEVAVDTFRSDSLNIYGIGIEGIIDRSCRSMAGSAVAGMVRIIKFVPRPIIGLFRVRWKLNKP